MNPTRIQILRGDTWRRAWLLSQPAGAPVDLTGATARLHLRSSSGTLAVEATVDNGRIVITPLDGRIALSVPAAVMAAVAPGSYVADLEVTFADGTVRTIERLAVTVMGDATYG